MRILVVEDEKRLCEALVQLMKKNNYTVDFDNDGESGLDYEIAEGINITAPAASLKQLVLILLDNALKYTITAGKVYANLSRENGKAVFYIENDGHINSDDMPHLFERFYRPDKSRARDSGGYGLGLAIAESICEGLGGKIQVKSEGGKTRFTVTINIAKT